MAQPKKGFLSGKKTYLAAFGTIVAALVSFAGGVEFLGFDFADFNELVQFLVTPVLFIFLRDGVKKEAK